MLSEVKTQKSRNYFYFYDDFAYRLITSYIMEWTTGSWLWDYTRFTPNFQGRIALNPSLRFGVGG